MSAMLAKRIEVRKLGRLSCNIQKLKSLIRNASSSAVAERPQCPMLSAVRSSHSIVLKPSEPVCQAGASLQENCDSTTSFVRSHSRLALNSTARPTNAEEQPHPLKRTVHCEVLRGGHHRVSQSMSAVQSINAPTFDPSKPTVIVDHKEGPCKRTLRHRAKEPKIVPSYLRLVEEDEISVASHAPRPMASRAMQLQPQRHDVNDKIVYEIDDSHKKCLHHIQFGKRDRRMNNELQNQLDETRLQQSISFFSDRKLVNTAGRRGGSVFVHPKFQVKQGRGTRTPASVTLKELHEARFGRTLNTLADKKLFKLSNLYTHDYNKFPIEDEMQVQAKLLARQKANKLRAHQQQLNSEDQDKANKVPRPAVMFGRRKAYGESREARQDVNNVKSTEEIVINQHSNVSATAAAAAPIVAAAIPPGAASPTPTPMVPVNNVQSAPNPAATPVPGSFVKPTRHDPGENIYKKFLRGEEHEHVVEIDAPRFDELYYREKDSLGKIYSQTWQDYPEGMLNTEPDKVRLVPPPFKKRPKDERPSTAKAWGDVDETGLLL